VRPADAVKLLYEPGAPALAFHPVSTRVNKVANDDESLMAPVAAESGPGQLSLL
jgi:putative SOS response-associated peptidase YedK